VTSSAGDAVPSRHEFRGRARARPGPRAARAPAPSGLIRAAIMLLRPRRAASIAWRTLAVTSTPSSSKRAKASASTPIRSAVPSEASIRTSGRPSTQHNPPRPPRIPRPKGSARTATPTRAASDSSSTSSTRAAATQPIVPPADRPRKPRGLVPVVAGRRPRNFPNQDMDSGRASVTLYGRSGRAKPWQNGLRSACDGVGAEGDQQQMFLAQGGVEARMTEASR
jgi:hypothetical protein